MEDLDKLFGAHGEDRLRKFLLRMSNREREFLEEEAGKRGLQATTIIRMCLRHCLLGGPKLPDPGR